MPGASTGSSVGSGTTGGGVAAPMRRMIICCRRLRRADGWAGSNVRGLLIAPASSADSAAESSDADLEIAARRRFDAPHAVAPFDRRSDTARGCAASRATLRADAR